jgi:hypothetical protein
MCCCCLAPRSLVGAVTGIGLVESVSGRRPDTAEHGSSKRAFNWLLLLKFFAGWVATLVVAGLTAAGELLPRAQRPTLEVLVCSPVLPAKICHCYDRVGLQHTGSASAFP